MKLITILIILSAVVYSRVDSHAPISVMGDHLHKQGDKMVSYRSMIMKMEDLYEGSKKQSEDDYFTNTNYMMAPKDMEMKMNMYGFMYGLTDKVNLALMLNTIETEMNMTRKMGRTNQKTTRSTLADSKVSLLYGHENSGEVIFLSKIGLIIPTGKHDLKRDNQLLGYPMQTGTGSYALSYGAVFTKFFSRTSLGLDFDYVYVLSENDEDYKVGNQATFNTWYSYGINDNLSLNLLYNLVAKDPYQSNDNSTMSSARDIKSQHGVRENLKLGINTIINSGYFEGHRFAFDIGQPIKRNLSGHQLDITQSYTLAWQFAF